MEGLDENIHPLNIFICSESIFVSHISTKAKFSGGSSGSDFLQVFTIIFKVPKKNSSLSSTLIFEIFPLTLFRAPKIVKLSETLKEKKRIIIEKINILNLFFIRFP